MNARISHSFLFWILFIIISSPVHAQLQLKLKSMDADTWGVFASPTGISPSENTITGSGQVTIVMPAGFQWGQLTSYGGLWINDATYVNPEENEGWQYVSFGLQAAEPVYPINFQAGEETLLFTIDRLEGCPDSIYLIDCGTSNATDPFCPPNSAASNPANDLSVIDFDMGPDFYNYSKNYAPSAWSCNDCDNDGIPDGLEDTNGNGVYDPGIDASDLCDPCDPQVLFGGGFPFDVETCDGLPAGFAFNFQNPGAVTTDYQWQISANGGASWYDLSEGSSTIGGGAFVGVHTDSLAIISTTGLDGNLFRLQITTDQCTYYSETASLTLLAEDVCDLHLGCLELKLELLANETTWGVFVKPDDLYAPSGNIEVLDGNITLVAPQTFYYSNFYSQPGTWSPVPTLGIMPGQPGMAYLQFQLEANDPPIKLNAGEETLLFTFDRVGDCPDTLFLVGKAHPSVPINVLTGHDPDHPLVSNFEFCGIYDPGAWSCPMFTGEIVEERSGGEAGANELSVGVQMQVAPNPADEFIDVMVKGGDTQYPMQLRLYSLAGRKLYESKALGARKFHIPVETLDPGFYFLVLEVNGRIIQRERVVIF